MTDILHYFKNGTMRIGRPIDIIKSVEAEEWVYVCKCGRAYKSKLEDIDLCKECDEKKSDHYEDI